MRLLLCCLCLMVFSCTVLHAKPLPTPQQLAWADYEIGAMISFEMWTFLTNYSENTVYHVPPVNTFNPVNLDTDLWLEAAVTFQAKYAVLTAKHDAGFCLFPTQYPGYNYSVLHTKWGNGQRDIVQEFINSCTKYNVKPAIYYSVYNNFYMHVTGGRVISNNTKDQKHYIDIVEFQLNELWSNYGELIEIWFDGGLIPPNKGGPNVVPMMKQLQPNAVVFNSPPAYQQCIRWVGNEAGVATDPNWSTCDVDSCSNGGDPNGIQWCPSECDTPLRGNGRHDWFWLPDGEKYIKTLPQLITEYIASVGHNGNYLLNINPNNMGTIDHADMQRYKEFGVALDAFSPESAIANTTGSGSQIDLVFDAPTYVDHIILKEQQAKGENVRLYIVLGQTDPTTWTILVNNGTAIGHKKIDAIPAVEVLALRFLCLNSIDTPLIDTFAAYFIGPF